MKPRHTHNQHKRHVSCENAGTEQRRATRNNTHRHRFATQHATQDKKIAVGQARWTSAGNGGAKGCGEGGRIFHSGAAVGGHRQPPSVMVNPGKASHGSDPLFRAATSNSRPPSWLTADPCALAWARSMQSCALRNQARGGRGEEQRARQLLRGGTAQIPLPAVCDGQHDLGGHKWGRRPTSIFRSPPTWCLLLRRSALHEDHTKM
jgi:hypothetical protein